MNFCTVVLQKFMSTLITKAEFARRVGVGRSCVGAWVSTGKLDGALVAVGRGVKVDEEAARRLLGDRLDVEERIANGRAMLRGDVSKGAHGPVPGESAPSSLDPVTAGIRAERLRQLQHLNAKAEAEAAERIGKYVLASDMRQEIGRITGSMIASVEGGWSSLQTLSRSTPARRNVTCSSLYAARGAGYASA